jgi:hypothetical protein
MVAPAVSRAGFDMVANMSISMLVKQRSGKRAVCLDPFSLRGAMPRRSRMDPTKLDRKLLMDRP